MTRRLADADVGDVLPEEEAGGLGDAVNGERAALAEVDVVEVELEDFVFEALRSSTSDIRPSRPLRRYEPQLPRSPLCSSALNSSARKNIRDSCCVMVLLPPVFSMPKRADAPRRSGAAG